MGQYLVSLAILAAAAGVVYTLGKAPPPPAAPAAEVPPIVAVAAAEPSSTGLRFAVDGVVRPYRDLDVAAESGGRVMYKSANCRVGRAVDAGEVLIRIDPRDYELEVRRLGEELQQAEVAVAELRVQIRSTEQQVGLAEQALRLNQRELHRVQSIGLPGAVTESDIDAATRDVVAAKISLQSQRDQLLLLRASEPRLRSSVERTAAQLEAAELALQRCVLRAPIRGVVTEEHVEQDGYLQTGALVFTVRDTSRLDVRCSLLAEQLAALWAAAERGRHGGFEFPETPVTVVYTLGGRRFAWDGVLARFDGAGFDEQTRMAPCIVRVEEPRSVRVQGSETAPGGAVPPTLLVGMFVEVQIRLQPRRPLLRVPAEAVRPGNQVWVVERGILQSKVARVAETNGRAALVYDEPGGLSRGAQVVVSPLASPVAGQRVRTAQRGEEPS